MKRIIYIALSMIALVTLACGTGTLPNIPDQSGVETIVAATMQALTPTFPVYRSENIAISIPNAVGTGITTTKTDNVELPFINPSNGPMPQHTVLEISGYPIGRQAYIMIFKASEYSSYTDLTRQTLTTLQTFQYQTGQPLPNELTLGPLNPQAQALTSENAHGLRYLAQIIIGVVPVANDQIFYYYQGLTNDGLYYISAVFPVNAPFLASNGDPSSLPIDGIPFPPDNAVAEELNTYYVAIGERLNHADPSIFQPSLNALDSIIQSITIQ